MELKGTKINFLGDSITEGAGTSSHDKMFTMLIEREYGAICQNYGIGGTRIARQKTPTEEKWDRDFISLSLIHISDPACPKWIMTRILWWFSAALTISATATRRSAQ